MTGCTASAAAPSHDAPVCYFDETGRPMIDCGPDEWGPHGFALCVLAVPPPFPDCMLTGVSARAPTCPDGVPTCPEGTLYCVSMDGDGCPR